MPTRLLLPGNRSASLPWLIWTLWRAAATCVSSSTSGHYPGGIVPATAWTADGSGSPTLLQCVATASDGLAAKFIAGGAVSTRFLVSELATDSGLSGTTLRAVRFKVARRQATGNVGNVVDEHVYLTKNGAPLTSVDKLNGNSWVANSTTPELVYYTFDATDLATLGVTVSDITGGTIGLAIQVATTGSATAFVDQVQMQLAYSPVAEPQIDYCQLPGSIALPSPWLRIYTFTPSVPNDDVVMGIEVDIVAWTDAANSAAADPVTSAWYLGQTQQQQGGGSSERPGNELSKVPDDGTKEDSLHGDAGGDQSPHIPDPPSGSFYYPLEVALSLDGTNPVGETWYIFTTATVQMFTCGSSTYLWNRGATWLPADFSGQFSVLVRRPTTPSAVSSQYVTTARVRLTTTTTQGSLSMSIRQELTEIVLLGAESTPGTLSNAMKRMRALNYKSRPNVNVKKFRPQGEKMNAVVIPTREWSTGSISGLMDYNELPIALEAIVGTGVHSGTGVADERNVHTYTLENRKRSAYKTYSLQRGEKTTRAHQNLYLVHSGLQLQINTQDCQVSGAFFAQKMTDGITLAAGVAEVQTMTITGTPTGGTYKLAFKGAETSALAYNANAAAIQTALQALGTIGSGNVLVTGSGPFTLTFASTLGTDNQPLVVLVNNSLTGGTSPTITITQTTRGGWTEYPLVPVLPGHWNIHLADTQAGLAAGKLDKTVGVAATGIDIADRWNPFFVLDRDVAGTFVETTEMDPKFTANLLVGANSTGMALLTTLRNGAVKWLRLEAVGPNIGATSDPHKMIWEGAVKVSDTADFGNEDGRVVYPWALEWTEGPNGEVPTLTIENGIVSY